MYWGAENEYKEYRKESEKTIKKWKEEAELERNQKLKLSIDNHIKGETVERLEVRVENLMDEYNQLGKTHDRDLVKGSNKVGPSKDHKLEFKKGFAEIELSKDHDRSKVL